MDKKILIVAPTAMFYCKLRTMCSGMLYAKLMDRVIYHDWSVTPYTQNESKEVIRAKLTMLEDYFTASNCTVYNPSMVPDICYSEWLMGEFWYERQSYSQKKLDADIIVRLNSDSLLNETLNIILVESSYILKPSKYTDDVWRQMLRDTYVKEFIPQERFLKMLTNTQYDAGIYVFKSELVDGTDKIVNWIKNKFDGKNIIIHSDDDELSKQIRLLADLNDIGFTSYQPLEEWENEFIKFLAISRCNEVYGMTRGAFVEEAATFGNKHYNLISFDTISFGTIPLNEIIFEDSLPKGITEIRKEFYDFGILAGTDKATYHGYHRFYPHRIKHLQEVENMSMLELGIQEQKSLVMWLKYFPKAYIYGMDIGVSTAGDRYFVFKGDQGNLQHLQELHKIIQTSKTNTRLIVDDASHVPILIMISFNYLFKNLLAEGGVYIIEDIETSYYISGNVCGNLMSYGYRHPKSVIEIFKILIDDINNEYLSPSNKIKQSSISIDVPVDVKAMISSIEFCHNCIIITKKTKDEYKYVRANYRWPQILG